MPRLFISYRRADSQHITDRIHEHLQAHFGKGNVFQDVGDIPFGVDFPDFLRAELEKCDVILIVIGAEWGRVMYERRAEVQDFVRIEVETALALRRETGKLVIPVTVGGAVMPDMRLLPESIHPLCRINAARVRPNPDFTRDCQVLAEGIITILGRRNQQNIPQPPPQPAPLAGKVIVGEKSTFTLPLLEWVSIPAGTVTLEAGGYLDRPSTFNVPAFMISKYPITIAQYDAFVVGGGYTTAKWWEGMAKRFPMPPEIPDFGDLDHPKVMVSWYEAMAFCQWLSDRTGLSIYLPAEQMWQRAAQGDDGREYPWGKWAEGHSNYDAKYEGTTSVTHFAGLGNGDSPFGVSDMTGNVWEWCATSFVTGEHIMGGEDNRIIRGGSWIDTLATCRTTMHAYCPPAERGISFGFRVVVFPLP